VHDTKYDVYHIDGHAPHERNVRTAFGTKEMTNVVSCQSPDSGQPGARQHALLTASTMIGAMVLTRAVDVETLSDAALKAALTSLNATGD
jgi:TetR/AcrR family transcriptional regulator, transcriptional repressor for nem operon